MSTKAIFIKKIKKKFNLIDKTIKLNNRLSNGQTIRLIDWLVTKF